MLTKQNQNDNNITSCLYLEMNEILIKKSYEEAAKKLGYQFEDLLPLNRKDIQSGLYHFCKDMTQIEKEFYINKKIQGLEERRKGIIHEVESYVNPSQNNNYANNYANSSVNRSHQSHTTHHNNRNRPKLNPVQQLFEQHKKIIERKERQNMALITRQRNLNERKSLLKMKMNQTVHIESPRSRVSQQSQRSKASQESRRSSTSANKERLMIIRNQQQENQNLKKHIFHQRQQEHSKKSFKAQEELLKKSRKIKTRSDISKKIVLDHREEIQWGKHQEALEHIQKLKYKVMKTELIRENQRKKKQEQEMARQMWREDNLKIKKVMEDEVKMQKIQRYQNKEKNIQMQKQIIALNRTQNIKNSNANRNSKISRVQNCRQYQQYQEQSYKKQMVKFSQIRHQTANSVKENYLNQIKSKGRDLEWKNSMTRSRRQTLNLQKKLNWEEKSRRNQIRAKQLHDIEKFKDLLIKERHSIDQQMSRKRKHYIGSDIPKFNTFDLI